MLSVRLRSSSLAVHSRNLLWSRLGHRRAKVPQLEQIIGFQFIIYISQCRWITDLYDVAHDGTREPYNLHDLGHIFFLGWICTKQTLHNISQRQELI